MISVACAQLAVRHPQKCGIARSWADEDCVRQTVRKIAAIHPAIRLSGPRRAGLKCGRHGSCLAAPAPGHTGFHGIRSGIYGVPPLRPGFRCTSSGLPFVARMQRSGIREKQFPERFELSSSDCRKSPGPGRQGHFVHAVQGLRSRSAILNRSLRSALAPVIPSTRSWRCLG